MVLKRMPLPDLRLSALTPRSSLPSARDAARLDALVVLCTTTERTLWRLLPEQARWRRLHAREAAVALKLRSSSLANSRQTQIVLGYVKDGASAFERLSFAGRVMRELVARAPQRVGLVVAPGLTNADLWYEALLSAAWSESYALPEFRSRPTPHWALAHLELFAAPELPLPRIAAAARAANLARALTALPPNELDAAGFRRLLTDCSRQQAFELHWYSERRLKALGAGAFLAVARGNAARDAGIAHLRWRGRSGASARAAKPDVALIGKGIVFDTGGVNVKSHRHMLDMHTDMAGSAVAFATLLALIELRAPLDVDVWLAISENNIGPSAYRPQEVVRASNGTTIQVIHSDAEGRMVLADTLALAARTQPQLIIDYATLTGACVTALTERYSGVFTNRPELVPRLQSIGEASGERVWPFPLDQDFDTDLESTVADVLQCAVDGKGDHILAARFLQRFVADKPWVHMDLSAAMRRGGLAHVGTEITGFGVRWTLEALLTQHLHATAR